MDVDVRQGEKLPSVPTSRLFDLNDDNIDSTKTEMVDLGQDVRQPRSVSGESEQPTTKRDPFD